MPLSRARTRQLFCLLGDPVAHSLSPRIHARAFQLLGVDAVYAPCPVAAADLPTAVAGLRALGAAGFNVTVPHKGAALALCDRVSEQAERIGAVSCVQRSPEDGRLVGHNTDAPGLLRALRGLDLTGARVVVLGAGGSARAAALALAGRAASLQIVNRTGSKARALAELCRAAGCSSAEAAPIEAVKSASLVVHCTTVGLGTDELPFDPVLLAPGATLVDLVYSKMGATALVRAVLAQREGQFRAPALGHSATAALSPSPALSAEDRTAPSAAARTVPHAIDGLAVLVHQAIASLEIWFGREHLDHLYAPLREAALS